MLTSAQLLWVKWLVAATVAGAATGLLWCALSCRIHTEGGGGSGPALLSLAAVLVHVQIHGKLSNCAQQPCACYC